MSFYKHHVFFCCNQREPGERPCCNDKGATRLRDYAKSEAKRLKLSGPKRARINQAGCLDRCELGPCMVVYPEGVWYRYGNEQDIDEILSEHVQNGRVVQRLKLPS